MTEGTIGTWRKNEGDKVEPGDILAKIQTDRATMEMESIESGYLAKILVKAVRASTSPIFPFTQLNTILHTGTVNYRVKAPLPWVNPWL